MKDVIADSQQVFRMLACQSRRAVLLLLAGGPETGEGICKALNLSTRVVANYINQLRRANLVDHCGFLKQAYLWRLKTGRIDVSEEALTFNASGYQITIGRSLKEES